MYMAYEEEKSLQELRWEGFSTQTAENRKNGQKPFPNSVAKINHENPPYNRNAPLLEKHNVIVMIMDISPKKFEVLRMFYGPIAEQENAGLPQPLAESTISEAIKNLPPGLWEMIFKEYVSIKMKQREALGWEGVHFELLEAPF